MAQGSAGRAGGAAGGRMMRDAGGRPIGGARGGPLGPMGAPMGGRGMLGGAHSGALCAWPGWRFEYRIEEALLL